jgi:hypothetical protein
VVRTAMAESLLWFKSSGEHVKSESILLIVNPKAVASNDLSNGRCPNLLVDQPEIAEYVAPWSS